MHDARKADGIPPDQIYGPIFYVLAGLMIAGFVANLLIKPLHEKWFMKKHEVEAFNAAYRAAEAAVGIKPSSAEVKGGRIDLKAIFFWAAVGIPLSWGIWVTLEKALMLFE